MKSLRQNQDDNDDDDDEGKDQNVDGQQTNLDQKISLEP